MSLKLALVVSLCFSLALGTPLSFRRRGGKIVGGVESVAHSHPAIVSIQVGSHYCGGTIVNENYIVTAAHCATLEPNRYSVVAGEHDLYSADGAEQRRSVEKVVQHPSYSSVTSRNDIAVFKVTPPFVFNENVTAGNIAPEGFEPSQALKAIGWGTTSEGGSIPDRLQEVVVPLVDDVTCRRDYTLVVYIWASMICAGESGKDSCQGDSGGPLVSVDDNGVETLVGVTSFGVGCARPRYPGVYSEVSHFAEWIATETSKA